LAHSSIVDGIPRSIRTVESYPHLDTAELGKLLIKYKGEQVLIATDGIFALTGEIAPLDQIHQLAEKYNALILVDDAHASGVLGETGKGTPEYFGLDGSPLIFQSETMSKALGAYGGFIAGSSEMIAEIRKTSPFYGASTSLPPAAVASGIAALEIIGDNPGINKRLIEKAVACKKKIGAMGFDTIQCPTPIIPLFFSSEKKAEELSEYLATNKIVAPAVKYPVKLDRYLVRLTLSAAHTQEQLDFLLTTLEKWRNNDGRN
jgi:7-keto-8-aminopelargonate synthetase-like enzyme